MTPSSANQADEPFDPAWRSNPDYDYKVDPTKSPTEIPKGWALTLHKIAEAPPNDGPLDYVDGDVLYSIWASASGKWLDHPTWESIGQVDRDRWAFFAKHHPIAVHDTPRMTPDDPKDVQKYPKLASIKDQITYADWDEMTNPTPPLNYQQWRAKELEPVRIHFWQLWKPRAQDIDTSLVAYKLWCTANGV